MKDDRQRWTDVMRKAKAMGMGETSKEVDT